MIKTQMFIAAALLAGVVIGYVAGEKALELFDRETIGSVRLIGFGVTNIQDSPDADGPSLFPSPEDERREKRERLSAALDNLRDRGILN